MISVRVHPDASAWAPTRADAEKILSWFSPKLTQQEASVLVLPRSEANREVGRDLPPYSFRAFTRGDQSRVFADATETPQSVAFVIAHELCHQVVHRTPTLEAAFADARGGSRPPWSDVFHEVDAEERFCDGIASRILGTWYDRAWWRRRVDAAVGPTPPVSRSSFGALPDAYEGLFARRVRHRGDFRFRRR